VQAVNQGYEDLAKQVGNNQKLTITLIFLDIRLGRAKEQETHKGRDIESSNFVYPTPGRSSQHSNFLVCFKLTTYNTKHVSDFDQK
jgi:hypothetical protein